MRNGRSPSSWRRGMLYLCWHKAATLPTENEACKLVKFSPSDDDRGYDEAEKEGRIFSSRRPEV